MTNKPAPVRSSLPPEARIHFAITEWTRLADELAEAGDVAALGTGLGRLRELRRQLTDLERHVEDHTAALMSHKQIELGDRVLVRHSGTSWTGWQSPELVRTLSAKARTDENGEIAPASPDLERFITLMEKAARQEWRIGALREEGIDPEEYAEKKQGRATVQIVEADHD